MVSYTAVKREEFWEFLFQLEALKRPVKLDKFLKEQKIEKGTFFTFIEQAHLYGLTLNLETDGKEYTLFPLSWHREFGDVLLEKSEYRELVTDLQNCIETGRTCLIKFLDNSEMEVYPWRNLFFESNLSVIVEDVKTKRLITIEIEQVLDLEVRGDGYRSMFSRLEVEGFINSMRMVAGSDERLIIKIQCGAEIKMPSELIFLGNPYTTTNQYGDIIWAASVEKSGYLFEWLYSIRDKIDILDPSSIKSEFERFCDTRTAA